MEKTMKQQSETIVRSLKMNTKKNNSILTIEVIPQLCLVDSSILQEKGQILEATFYLLADIINKHFTKEIFDGVRGGQIITDNKFIDSKSETDFGFCEWIFKSNNNMNINTLYDAVNISQKYLHVVFILERDLKELNKDGRDLLLELNLVVITDDIMNEVKKSKSIFDKEFIKDIIEKFDMAA